MLRPVLKTTLITLALAAIIGAPAQLFAQTQEKPATDTKAATEKKETGEKKASAGPFHGKLGAVDKAGKTITVGKRTFHITSETKLFKAGKPATLEAGVVGDEVSGYVKPDANGKLVATKVNFGPKVETKAADAKKEK
jgi:hypothetical protein